MTTPPYLQLVVKVSKFCNLRCRYCYEYPSLGDRTAMTVPQVRTMIRHVGEWLADQPGRTADFVWHGGEPLLMPHAFYREVKRAQQEFLEPAGIPYGNSVQTNLYRLTDEDIAVIREVFDDVGVSVDLVGGQRVTVAGRQAQPRVLAHMQRLLDEGLDFGCITVLSRSTAPHVAEIHRFFEDVGLGFRLLPVYRTGYPGQQARHGLTAQEIVTALKTLTDRWLASDSSITVEPVDSYAANVVHALHGAGEQRFYDKEQGETILVVDTDGSVYSNGDAYDPALRHGDIFTESLSAMRRSPSFGEALRQSRERVRQTCTGCRYFGSCSGFFAAESTPEQRWRDPVSGLPYCGVVRPVQQYIEERLTALGLVDRVNRRLDPALLERRALG
ncbi:radical SAM protein [Streptantibioticus rubrisoli]|uniref:Radical SAM protein n=1 Tax=Streptantibioticus rubrisoli TaxID=1387313 RepID=A0ABT1P5Z3_9ACTN|nr:radical SAM protein [Streptantibioticus rubrisoli]MCQ4040791.1 radical SAM protein [Streptantibioticus rubrisoli]